MVVFNIKEEERKIFELIRDVSESLDYPAYVVGGYVRDRLMKRSSNDVDIVCVGDGIELANEVANRLNPSPRVSVYSRFGTAMIRHNDMEIEFVGARKESYNFDSRKPDVEPGTLEDDQYRRDFTINALAVSLNEGSYGEILDPFDGLKHLEERLIKTPLEPGKTFSDDPLRMMRAIRFATELNFYIDDRTLEAVEKYRTRINIVSIERVVIELQKILGADRPSKGFKLLHNTGLLSNIFPELEQLHGVDYKQGRGHKDNFYHTLEVVDNVAEQSDNIWLRWAALLHDIAKPATKRFHPEAGWTFHGHDALGAAMVPRIFRKLKLPLDSKMKYVRKLVRLHLRPVSLTQEDITDSAVRRLLYEAGDDLEDLMILCEADITSKNPDKVKRYLRNYENLREKLEEVEKKDRLRNWEPPISGDIIMETFDIPPSRTVGDIKTAIREAILDGDIPNEYGAAFEYMIQIGKEMGLSVQARTHQPKAE